ncbi:GILT-like protein 1 [Adelges cooleyi]|uniref:GILT-like protein 1 n=1 Tax=Adelges cooleyi TaxID=133065 RepID=UPI00217F72E8|nr:GILT-like protein 1 [Adelges cooleyi]XP_050440916.1 GILT-like protein 1 [Adelges cooleyi]XP_050440924.1 GILT-like protein 1 [Adelges cooleyi]
MDHRVKITIFFLVLSVFAQYSQCAEPSSVTDTPKTPVHVELYYEGQCQKSQKFIEEELIPTYKTLSQHLNIELIPFAKSTITHINATTNEYNLTCPRGVLECEIDKVHACAIKHITSIPDKLNFLNCTMKPSNEEKLPPTSKCATQIKLQAEIITAIENCLKVEVFQDLKTYNEKSLAAKVEYVPTILINNTPFEKKTNATTGYLKSAICENIPEPKPKECTSDASGSDAIVAGILPLLIGAYYLIKTF